jgi:prephenate dehydratase
VSQKTRALKVAFQGEPGAYSQKALRDLFEGSEAVPLPSIHRVFESVEIGTSDYGVVPLENSQAGSINETYDLLVRHGVKIVAERIVRISHCLLGLRGSSVGSIKVVFSHPQALAQCAEFLDSLRVERVALHDTAGAARVVAEEKKEGSAAIASEEAAALYGLDILARDIEDRPDNSTKFVAIGREDTSLFGPANKTSIVLVTANVPGALYSCLKEFAERSLNLTKLESRPSREKAWQSYFYLDFEASAEEPSAKDALQALAEHTSFLRVLGSYPASVLER